MANQTFPYRRDIRPPVPEGLGEFVDREFEKIETALANFTPSSGGGGTAGVSSFNTRIGAVTLSSADVTGALGFTPVNPGSLSVVATSGSYADLIGKPTALSAFTNDTNFITASEARAAISVSGSLSYNSTTGVISYTAPVLATVATSGAYADLTGRPALAPVATSGAYSDLTGGPTLLSAFTNDVGFLSGTVPVTSGGTGATSLTTGRVLVGNGTGPVTASLWLQENANGLGIGRAPTTNFLFDAGGASGTVQARFLNSGTTATDVVNVHIRTLTTGAIASTCAILFGDADSTNSGRLLYNHGTDIMQFRAAGAEQMYLSGTGLGIGVTSPSYKLHVNGTAVATAFLCNSTGGIGYMAGAGGVVTQATSKATAVTLNKLTGQITLNAASLAADTTVSFVLNNSTLEATDMLVLSHHSTGTFGAYVLNGRVTGAGVASIDVRNVSAAALAENIVIKFAVIKAATA